jgi:tetratricopeptide (TPR) repeat protein
MKKVALLKVFLLVALTNEITGCLQQSQANQPSNTDSPSVNVESLLKQGNSKFDSGDYRGAIANYDQAIKLNPGSATAYHDRGFARSSLGDKSEITDYDQAIQDYTQAIKLKPDFVMAYLNRGSAHFDLGDKQAAIADYDQAIKFKPDFILAYLNRGNAHAGLGNNQAAIADLTKVSATEKNQ